MSVVTFGVALFCSFGTALAGGPWLPENVSTIGEDIDHLYRVIFVITTIMFVLTQGVLVFFIFRYRQRPGRRAAYVHDNATVETVWTVVPGIILLVLAVYQWNAWADAKIRAPDSDEAIRVEILAQQFEWNIRYPGPDGVFDTQDDLTMKNQLYIPRGKPVLVQLRALDVIHSFFLPNLRVKQDVLPGPRNTILLWFDANKSGTYEIACAELCGLGHYRMRGQLFVYTPEEFETWLENKYKAKTPPADWGWGWEDGV
ncbi:MAG: cytochrome c oxidase subunit II [Candidatus Krumholzibacteria bacterium]